MIQKYKKKKKKKEENKIKTANIRGTLGCQIRRVVRKFPEISEKLIRGVVGKSHTIMDIKPIKPLTKQI